MKWNFEGEGRNYLHGPIFARSNFWASPPNTQRSGVDSIATISNGFASRCKLTSKRVPRGFHHWRFAYAGPGVRRSTTGPASANPSHERPCQQTDTRARSSSNSLISRDSRSTRSASASSKGQSCRHCSDHRKSQAGRNSASRHRDNLGLGRYTKDAERPNKGPPAGRMVHIC
jgi:hypothetical protein